MVIHRLISRFPITRYKLFIAGILYRILVLFIGKKPRLIQRKGIYYEVDLREGIDLHLFLFGGFQSQVVRERTQGVIIDVGANFGAMSLQYAKAGNTVYAIEPTHYALQKFQRNLELNPTLSQRIKVFQLFLSDKADKSPKIKAYSSWRIDKRAAQERHKSHRGLPKSTQGVAALTLDALSQREQIEHIAGIKIDVDGYEWEVIKGAREVIARWRPEVVFEVGLYQLQVAQGSFPLIMDYFHQLDYRLFHSKSGRQITKANYRKHIPHLGTIDLVARPTPTSAPPSR